MGNPFSALLRESRRLLATIDEPMARAFVPLLDRASDADPDTVADAAADEIARPFPLGGLPAWADQAPPATRAAVTALTAASPSIPWVAPDRKVVAPGWADQAATAELVGPDGAIPPATNERFGILYLEAGVDYPEHWHDAEEFYVVLTGGGAWTIDGTTTTLGPGDFSRTPSGAPHRIVTGALPVLTLYGWSGDTSYDSYGF